VVCGRSTQPSARGLGVGGCSYASAVGLIKELAGSTAAYERWVDRRTPTWPSARTDKHARMAAGPFPFLRATYYRWVALVGELPTPPGPVVDAVGDLHVENFGTWRDVEARLVWGVNDLDEADRLPAGFDLLRLVTSADLARTQAGPVPPQDVVEPVLEGYAEALRGGGARTVLDAPQPLPLDRLLPQQHAARWWARLQALPRADDAPVHAVRLLSRAFPPGAGPADLRRRTAGMGSRDHLRLVAVADLAGAPAVREAKALSEPATWWLHGRPAGARVGALATGLVARGRRSPDPTLRLHGRWVVRRLAPWADRIELADLRARADVDALLRAMGVEIGTLHLASASAAELGALTGRAGRRWLTSGAARMTELTLAEAAAWRRLNRPARAGKG
jgi:hypothetical protein